MTRNATPNTTIGASRVMRFAALLALALAATLAFAVVDASSATATAAQLEAPSVKTPAGTTTKNLVIARDRSTKISTSEAGDQRRWASSNTKVAKVKSTGLYSAKVTAVAPGTATITAKNNLGTLTCKVTVTGLTENKVSISPFTTSKLAFKGCGAAKATKWATSDKKRVKVNSKGELAPMATGKAVITCTDSRGAKHKCVVTVKKPPITCKVISKFLFQQFSLTNKSGKAIALNTNVLFFKSKKATSPTVLYTSSVTGAYLTKSPITVKIGKSINFFGEAQRHITLTSSSHIKVGFKIGKARYLAAFSPITGQLLACARQ